MRLSGPNPGVSGLSGDSVWAQLDPSCPSPNRSRPRLTYRAGLSLLGSSCLLFFPEPIPAKLRLGEGMEQVRSVPAMASSGRPVPTHLRACCPRCP